MTINIFLLWLIDRTFEVTIISDNKFFINVKYIYLAQISIKIFKCAVK